MKRGNVNSQQRREDYEQQEKAISSIDVGGGFDRASKDQLNKRRIISVRRPIAPPPSSISTVESPSGNDNKSSNPFASIKLTTSAATTSNNNPFGSFSTSNTLPSAAKSMPSTTFSFPVGNNNTTTASAPASSLFTFNKVPTTKPVQYPKQFYTNSKQLLKTMTEKINNDNNNNNNNVVMNCSDTIMDYIRHTDKLVYEWNNIHNNNNNYTKQQQSTSTGTNTATTSTTTAPISAKTSSSAPTLNFGSFAPKPTEPPKVEFANTAAAPSSNTDAVTTNEDGEVDNTKYEETKDPDWDTVHEFDKIRFYRYQDKAWKAFAKGLLVLQKHNKTNTNNQHRMVMRDTAGLNVHVNMLITNNMQFNSTTIQRKNNKTPIIQIQFTGINDIDIGLQEFRIVTLPDIGTKLQNNLQQMASS